MYRGQPQVPSIDVEEAAAAAGGPSRAAVRGPAAGGPSRAAVRGRATASESASDTPAPAPLLVDVRERNEFLEVRAPGAVLYPTSSFLLRVEELPKDRPLHVICRTGSRSAAVTAFLLRNGWTDVHDVTGGMVAWLRADLDVRRGPLDPGEGDLA